MRGIALTAAALAVAFAVGFAVRGGDSVDEAAAYACSATDQRFIKTATANMTALGIWSEGYKNGDIEADEVARQARDAARRVTYVQPRNPALKKAQRLMDAMFLEYGQAVSLAAEEKSLAGTHMHRAYGLANFARDVLLDAQPALAKNGCDVTPLL